MKFSPGCDFNVFVFSLSILLCTHLSSNFKFSCLAYYFFVFFQLKKIETQQVSCISSHAIQLTAIINSNSNVNTITMVVSKNSVSESLKCFCKDGLTTHGIFQKPLYLSPHVNPYPHQLLYQPIIYITLSTTRIGSHPFIGLSEDPGFFQCYSRWLLMECGGIVQSGR